jgi:hypothetical protein
MIQMIKEKQNIINMPEGLPNLLFDTLTYVMKMPDSLNREADILKIYASFIRCNISLNWAPIEPETFVLHWQHINSLSDSYEGETLHTTIGESLKPLT